MQIVLKSLFHKEPCCIDTLILYSKAYYIEKHILLRNLFLLRSLLSINTDNYKNVVPPLSVSYHGLLINR